MALKLLVFLINYYFLFYLIYQITLIMLKLELGFGIFSYYKFSLDFLKNSILLIMGNIFS